MFCVLLYTTNDHVTNAHIINLSKFYFVDHLSKASKGVSAIDSLIGTVLVSTTICHYCFTVSTWITHSLYYTHGEPIFIPLLQKPYMNMNHI